MAKPVIHPVRWQPPRLTPLPRPDLSATVHVVPVPGFAPEDVVVDAEGTIWTGADDGSLIRVTADGTDARVVANTGGRPLGLAVAGDGRLLICDSPRGLLRYDPNTGEFETLVSEVAGRRLTFCSNVVESSDGTIFFTESAAGFNYHNYKGAVLEARGGGALYRRDLNGRVEVLASGLYFTNGVTLTADESALVFAESTGCRLRKYWLTGERAGSITALATELPGYPDNISTGSDGSIWVSLVSERNRLSEWFSPRSPILRKLLWQLPYRWMPGPKPIVWVAAFDAEDGHVRHQLRTTHPTFGLVTGVAESAGRLWLGSIGAAAVGYLDVSSAVHPEDGNVPQKSQRTGWQFWVDRGGTFTDIVARRPDGRLLTHKLLSEHPERYHDAAIAGIRVLLGIPDHEPIPVEQLDAVRMGTTVATNALLERSGARTLLVITAGFGDALRIAYQNRPHLFDRHIVLPELLYERVVEVDERVMADGTVLQAPNLTELDIQLRQALAEGIHSVAVVCLHSYLYPAHEHLIGQRAEHLGFSHISLSCKVSPLMKLIPRGDTTVVDAYLSPVLNRYISDVAEQLRGVRLMFMQSNGGLAEAEHFRGKDAVLSGPAGGIVGMARMSELAGFHRVIGFDMGGTSTDVSHYAGTYERVFTAQVAGVRLQAPMLDIHTIAAGGGSILHCDGNRYRVGPDSAGAAPGPTCYGNGGPLTVTDANVLLGRIQAAHFPAVFGAEGNQPLNIDAVRSGFAELAATIQARTGDHRSPEQVADGFLQIAVANMANAIKKVSIQRGHDVTAYALTTFGGAGGQHACAIADALGIRTVLSPPMAGVLSALGIGLANTTVMREQAVELPLTAAALPQLAAVADRLQQAACAQLHDEGIAPESIRMTRRVHLRYQGTDTAAPIELTDLDTMTAAFTRHHRAMYSFVLNRPLIAEALSVEATGLTDQPDLTQPTSIRAGAAADISAGQRVKMYSNGSWRSASLQRREQLLLGEIVTGPALLVEENSTTVVDDGWQATMTGTGHLLIERKTPTAPTRIASTGATRADPVLLEIFNNLFTSIAEQMGTRLEATAQSVNIRERLDFSCALFDPEGNLVANAPHIPVHLGSMGSCVKEVIRRSGTRMRPGQVYAVNDPYHGGTHLPDVTVVTPVFAAERSPASDRPLFYVASRGHHAEIGGTAPGSMSATSRTVLEEGVLFDNWLLAESGLFREAETRQLLTEMPYGSRDPDTNLADLRAQVAANQKGIDEVHQMIEHFGLATVQAYMQHAQDNAEEAVRRVIATLEGGAYRYQLDSGATIAVKITVDHATRSATIDFTGTSPQLDTNFNAPSSVATAAVLYTFRTLVGPESPDIPLNDGCLRPLRIIIPAGSMLAPVYPAAVVAGNVETSQAITGALFAALHIQAEGSGTMNNVTFGNHQHQYYETVGSGSGAGDGFAGASVVQTHMTNSRLTDPEILEWRFPVLLREFAVRRGSGGAGRWPGGDGAVRAIEFTEPMTVSVLSGHRRVPPYGMAGGSTGALGRNRVRLADGRDLVLSSCDSVELHAGDTLIIETPGGGGYGPNQS